MKKYKLIKTYPTVPRSMVEGLTVEWNESMGLYHHALTLDTFGKSEVEFHTEFWEKIEEKFEILSFVRKGSKADGCIKTKGTDGMFGWDLTNNRNSESQLLGRTGFDIHSVRRLSDGEIFTLGDTVVRHADEHCDTPNTTPRVIQKMYKDKDTIAFDTSRYDTAYQLNLFSHVPKPLCTTHDGVDLYEGDVLYIASGCEVYKKTLKNTFKKGWGGDVLFSTKKLAEEYILMNKRLLSGQDVLDYLESVGQKVEKVDPAFIKFLKEKS